jgi:methyl-accepting chemotaxis protein
MTSVDSQVRGKRQTLRAQIMALVGASIATVSIALLITFDRRVSVAFDEELGKRASAVTLGLANALAYETFTLEKDSLEGSASATLRDVPDVVYVVFRTPKGEVLAQASSDTNSTASSTAGSAATSPPPSFSREFKARRFTWRGVPVLDLTAPIVFAARTGAGDGALFDPSLSGSSGATDAAEPLPRSVGHVEVGFRLDRQAALVTAMNLTALGVGLAAFLGALVAASYFTRRLTTPIERLSAAAVGIARGDLRQRVEVEGSDEIADLAHSFASMANSLQLMLSDLREASSELDREAADILETSSQQTAIVAQQSMALGEASSVVSSIARTARAATSQADAVIEVAQTSEELSQDGQRVVTEAVAGMEKLGDQVRAMALTIADLSDRTVQIGSIMTTLKDLAEQSTLLALNASIEASRAGEHGRGFSVVAQEMRTLADQSRLAAQEVRGLLFEVQKGTRAAVAAAEEGSKRAQAASALAQSAGRSIEGLTSVIFESSGAARQIATSSRQQTSGVEQMAGTITGLAASMNTAVEGTRRIEAVAGNLKQLSQRLTRLVSKYQG